MNTYNDMFMKLQCSTDVLNAVFPLRNPTKEISESFAIIQRIKGMTVRNPGKYSVLDLCAGNALTSILAAHLLPIVSAEAVDILPNKRNFENVKKFKYVTGDIRKRYGAKSRFSKLSNTIIVSSHPCQLATEIAEIFNRTHAAGICLIPCCHGMMKLPGAHFLRNFAPSYDVWSYYISTIIRATTVKITKDERILSPCNDVIFAER
jgi:hypothetical protein